MGGVHSFSTPIASVCFSRNANFMCHCESGVTARYINRRRRLFDKIVQDSDCMSIKLGLKQIQLVSNLENEWSSMQMELIGIKLYLPHYSGLLSLQSQMNLNLLHVDY